MCDIRFTDVFLYQNIMTHKGKNLTWIKFVFRSSLCSLYLPYICPDKPHNDDKLTQNTPILMAIKMKMFWCVVFFFNFSSKHRLWANVRKGLLMWFYRVPTIKH